MEKDLKYSILMIVGAVLFLWGLSGLMSSLEPKEVERSVVAKLQEVEWVQDGWGGYSLHLLFVDNNNTTYNVSIDDNENYWCEHIGDWFKLKVILVNGEVEEVKEIKYLGGGA